MKIVVLLSAGAHPVSGNPVLPRIEAQAIRIAMGLGEASGLHAGPAAKPVADALGHGLGHIAYCPASEGDDPVPALAERLAATSPDVILAGRRGQGGAETGLLPFAVAKALAIPIVSDVVAVARGTEAGTLVIDQARPKGAIRRLTIRRPVLLTIHPTAPPPKPFAYGQARRGLIETVPVTAPMQAPDGQTLVEERPYRPRPKVMRGAPTGGTAADRLKAATGDTGAAGANVMIRPEPDMAARAILSYLRRIGVLAPPPEPDQPV